jgi:integrase/recombinase XerD
MLYQDKREPLTADKTTRLANACTTHQEKLVVWTLLDTGLRVAKLAGLRSRPFRKASLSRRCNAS